MTENTHFFNHDISYYFVKVWIIIVHDFIILKAFQVIFKIKNSENTSHN